jgi:hypothetical protein
MSKIIEHGFAILGAIFVFGVLLFLFIAWGLGKLGVFDRD